MPQISVIVPVYKVEKYLMDCVQSIITQTYQDIEIILVDDGSPDQCGKICDILAEEDRRIRVIHQENQGLSCARNTGIEAAQGNYLCFVDSDDLIAPTYCQQLICMLENTEYDFSFCGVFRFEDGVHPTPPQKEKETISVVSNHEYLKMQFERRTEFGVWNKLFRRSFFDHIRFMPGKVHEDVIFSADLVSHLHHGAISTDCPLYLYRQREGSIVSVSSSRCNPDRIFAGEYLLNAVKQSCPALLEHALHYAIHYPWMFIDPIYTRHQFKNNHAFLVTMQTYLRQHIEEYRQHNIFQKIQLKRMHLFSRSRVLYGLNAYSRLARVYLYRIIGKDAYQDGHGI